MERFGSAGTGPEGRSTTDRPIRASPRQRIGVDFSFITGCHRHTASRFVGQLNFRVRIENAARPFASTSPKCTERQQTGSRPLGRRHFRVHVSQALRNAPATSDDHHASGSAKPSAQLRIDADHLNEHAHTNNRPEPGAACLAIRRSTAPGDAGHLIAIVWAPEARPLPP